MSTNSTGNSTRTVLIVLLAVLGVGGLGAVLCCGGFIWLAARATAELPQAQAAVDSFLDEVARGNAEVAYQSTTSGFRSSVSQDQFEGILKALPSDLSRASRNLSFARMDTMNGVTTVSYRGS